MNLKKKHQDAVAKMSEQIDQLYKMKAKIEKGRSNLVHEILSLGDFENSKREIAAENAHLCLEQ